MILKESIPGKVLIPVIFSTLCFLSVFAPFHLISFASVTDQIRDYVPYFSIFFNIVLGIAGVFFGIKYFRTYKRPLHRMFTVPGLVLGIIMTLLLTLFVFFAGCGWLQIFIYKWNNAPVF